MNRTLLAAAVGVLTLSTLVPTARAQTLGMVTDSFTNRVTVFDADANTILGSVDVPGFHNTCFGDCVITPDRQLGFVTNFQGVVWVIDLSGGAPVLAAGTNPIPVSTPGEDLALSLDGRFLLVGDGAVEAPLSVVDIATRAEVSTYPHPGGDCTSVEVCPDGSILATSTTSTVRLNLDGAGNVTTAGILPGATNLTNTVCVPGAATAVVFDYGLARATSITIPGLLPIDARPLADSPLCGAIHPDGDRLYVRSDLVQAFAYDPLTGDIGVQIFSFDPGDAASCYGVDQLAVHPDGDRFYLTQPGGIGIYDATSGNPIATISGPNLTDPVGIFLRAERPGPLFCIDFEVDDSGAPMPHGARVDTEFDGDGGFPTITGSLEGSGLNTLAILNSDTGPAAQDPDLLVGTGNILILQTDDNLSECPPASGIFCSHNDDEDGGTMTMSFEAAIEAVSIVLIDVDAGDGTWRVLLTDSAGGQRIFSVPAGWTEDGGLRMLDLTSLAPQPGFAAMATASQSPGFDSSSVQRIDVELGASGAIDDVCVVPSGSNLHQHPSVSPRNGSGVNSVTLSSLTLPVLGDAWSAQLDCSRYAPGLAVLEVRSGALQGRPSLFGEVLIAGELLARFVRVLPASVFAWPIPNSVSLAGVAVHAQGLCSSMGPSGDKMRFARGGLSNALDLVLGD